ncbi:hypothetical protein LDC_1094, partial [sediment metagenome]
ALGSSETNVTINVYRRYNTITAWEAACPANLVTDSKVWKGVCYREGAFDEKPEIDGTTTDKTHFIWLTVAQNQRHRGIAGTGAAVKNSTGGFYALINVYDPNVRVEWLELYGYGGATNLYGVRTNNANGTRSSLTICWFMTSISCMTFPAAPLL